MSNHNNIVISLDSSDDDEDEAEKHVKPQTNNKISKLLASRPDLQIKTIPSTNTSGSIQTAKEKRLKNNIKPSPKCFKAKFQQSTLKNKRIVTQNELRKKIAVENMQIKKKIDFTEISYPQPPLLSTPIVNFPLKMNIQSEKNNIRSQNNDHVMTMPVLSDVRSLAPKPITPQFKFNPSELTITPTQKNNDSIGNTSVSKITTIDRNLNLNTSILSDELTVIKKNVNGNNVKKVVSSNKKRIVPRKILPDKNRPTKVLRELQVGFGLDNSDNKSNIKRRKSKTGGNFQQIFGHPPPFLVQQLSELSTNFRNELLSSAEKYIPPSPRLIANHSSYINTVNTNLDLKKSETVQNSLNFSSSVILSSSVIEKNIERVKPNSTENNNLQLEKFNTKPSDNILENLEPIIILEESETIENSSSTNLAEYSSSSKNSESESDVQEINENYQQFIDLCFKIENTEDMEKIVQKMKRYYKKAPVAFVNSESFKELVEKEIKCAKKNPENLYFIIGEILDELKVRRVDEEDSLDSKELERREKRLNLQILKLEFAMKKYNMKIKELEEQEVGDDDDDDSPYILVDKYQNRLLKVYKKLCTLTGEREELNSVRGDLCKLSLCGGRMPRLSQAVVRMAEKERNWFPDFTEIYQSVVKYAKKDKMSLGEKELNALARQAFEEIGNVLKKRRLTEQINDLALMVGSTEDPADKDAELAAKLEESRKTFLKKEKEVFDLFVRKEIDSKFKIKTNNQTEMKSAVPENVKKKESSSESANFRTEPVINKELEKTIENDSQNIENIEESQELLQPIEFLDVSQSKIDKNLEQKQPDDAAKEQTDNLEPETIDEDVISIGDEDSDDESESEYDSDVLILDDDDIDHSDSELSGIIFSSDEDEGIEEHDSPCSEVEGVENSLGPKKRTISLSSDDEPNKKGKTDSSGHESS